MGTKKGGARKGQPKGSRLAYDDTETIKEDRELKPVKTRVRKTRKGKKEYGKKTKIPEIPVRTKTGGFYDTQGRRIDEAILRLIHTHYESDNIILAIQRLILGKYK